MKKKFVFLIISIFLINIYGEKYAILVSAGKTTTDDVVCHSEYWYDLFLAYEDLILNEGYKHENVYVFYGDGDDFESTIYNRYKASQYGWNDGIVDFPNDTTTIKSQLKNLNNIVTADDKLVIRWAVGHGSSNTMDDYYALIENQNERVPESSLHEYFNLIRNYKERVIFWMTCHSGCIKDGNVSFNNNKTTIITSSDWNENSYSLNLSDETVHAEMNYLITSYFFGEDPLGAKFNADDDSNYRISIQEAFGHTSNNSLMRSNLNLSDYGNIATSVFLDEINKLSTKFLLLY